MNYISLFSQSQTDSFGISIIESKCSANLDSLDGQFIYDFPDIDAEFPVGIQKLMSYIINSYTLHNVTEEPQINVRISFVIDSSGAVRNACVVRRNPEKKSKQELELEKIFQTIPDWKPALENGKKVYSRIQLPIHIDFR